MSLSLTVEISIWSKFYLIYKGIHKLNFGVFKLHLEIPRGTFSNYLRCNSNEWESSELSSWFWLRRDFSVSIFDFPFCFSFFRILVLLLMDLIITPSIIMFVWTPLDQIEFLVFLKSFSLFINIATLLWQC